MDQWQNLKADNLRGSFIQVLPNLKSCQHTKPKAPTSYSINCVMFMCLRVSAPGICWYTPVGEARGKGYNWEEKEDGLRDLRWLPWNMEQSLVPGGATSTCSPPGCLCCNVAQCDRGRRPEMMVPPSNPYSRPVPPLFDQSPGAIPLPFLGKHLN